MRDEDLREEFAAWLRPVREAEPPGLPAIRRRLRRRRTRQAAGGTAVLAAVAGVAVAVSATLGAPRAPAGSQGTTGAQGTTLPQGTTGPLSQASSIPVTSSSPRPVQGGSQTSSTYAVSAPVSTLVVSSGVGAVTITGSQRSTVSVTEQVQFSARPPAMTRTLAGKTLTLGYRCPDESMCSASYDIQVPRGVAVRVSSGVGEIRLSSLAGTVTAKSGTGLISAAGLTSRTASFTTNLGEINAVFATAPTTVHATTNLGSINLRVPGTVSYDVNAPPGELGSAIITIPQSSSSRHVIDAVCNMGSLLIGPS
jgi:hypothetical protein